MSYRRLVGAVTIGLAAHLAGCEQAAESPSSLSSAEETRVAEYVGGQQCAACHRAETDAWLGSHHDLAMQVADSGTVLGDFEDADFNYNDVTTEFFRRGIEYWVRTDGPDGEPADYQVSHAFGRGLATGRGRRPARVPSLSRRHRGPYGSAALDWHFSELERYLCGVSFNRSAEELRLSDG